MPSASDLDDLARRRIRRASIGALIAVGALIAIVMVAVALLDGDGRPSSAPPPSSTSTPPHPPTSDSVPEVPGSSQAPRASAQLPKPGDYLRGLYPVRFPHTAAGATAAAAAMYQYTWTVDPTHATRVVGVYVASEAQQSARRTAVDSVRYFRKQMDLPATGEVPAAATIAVRPIGVQWKIVDADNVYASVSMSIDMLPGTGEPSLTAPAASTVHMQWRAAVRGGDWVALRTPAQQMPSPHYAEPGTPQFTQQGWLAIRPGG
ncbi:hypothetical protein GCM10022226_78520 [Sphaerisporangium flaviroseum]|uniref:Tat pathway signal sequence domain protein n=1 Tax=Sphaerisporangium flaviroseum TaxID=509199 RepID=A0ABP7JFH7_9ACTN